MALWAIGDLHLALVVVDKDMSVFGDEWIGYVDKIKQNWTDTVKQEDVIVVTGDLSWGMSMNDVKPDLEFIAELPGRKILMRGNHDKFWKSNRTERLNKEYDGRLYFFQNNFYSYGDYALVGTKGFSLDNENTITPEEAQKLTDREAKRLRKSFEKAKAAGYKKFIMFLHYPPTALGQQDSVFTQMAEEYGAEQVIYSHLHGQKKYGNSIRGMHNGIEYRLVSSDYLGFKPELILE